MKAIVYTAPGAFEYTDVPTPRIAPDEVLIRVKACGLCRTDMHIHEGHFISAFPLTNGHEFAAKMKGRVASNMAPEQIAEAERLVEEWVPAPASCDAEAAKSS